MALDIVLLFGKDKKNVWIIGGRLEIESIHPFFGGFSIRQLIKAIIFFMGNKSENYSSQFFAGSFMHVWSFLQCLSNAKSPHDYLYRWKIPGENDDDDNYVFRQKLNLAKLSSTSNSNLRFLVNKSNFS